MLGPNTNKSFVEKISSMSINLKLLFNNIIFLRERCNISKKFVIYSKCEFQSSQFLPHPTR